jgi:electron transport complex protein RnfB
LFAAIASLTLLGLLLGLLLGCAARYLRVESNPLATELKALLPGANCAQCGYPGCDSAAQALAAGEAAPTLCPPGGKALLEVLAAKLGVSVDLASAYQEPGVARVNEAICIGCAHCFKLCPTDALVGAPKQLHTVIETACIGCGKCVAVCPTECLQLHPLTPTLQTWYWPKPVVNTGA